MGRSTRSPGLIETCVQRLRSAAMLTLRRLSRVCWAVTRQARATFLQALVSEVKAKVSEVTQIPVQLQRLIFRGRVLRDDSRIREHCIEDGDCLHLVLSPPPQEHGQAPPFAPELPEHAPGGVANVGAVRAVLSEHSLGYRLTPTWPLECSVDAGANQAVPECSR